MTAEERFGEVFLLPEDDFSVKKIFDCGQCFRWNAESERSYVGVAMGRAARVREADGGVYISGTLADFESVWRDYFDLSRSYEKMRESVCVDDYMRLCSSYGAGIRILRQDRWEALCSFIISQCNNIPRIKGIVERLCEAYGDEIDFEGRKYYSFPPPERIAVLNAGDLAFLRSGYRAPYIVGAAREIAEGRLDLEKVALLPYSESKKRLMQLNGVGEKVANCVILFGLRTPSAFPIDTWIKKALRAHYPDGLDTSVFGENAGLAQQYMFYYERENEA